MKDFILDDHDHAVSVASLGVQLFTMPTIAHMLVAEEDVLARLLNTFLSECDKKLKDSKYFPMWVSFDVRKTSISNYFNDNKYSHPHMNTFYHNLFLQTNWL